MKAKILYLLNSLKYFCFFVFFGSINGYSDEKKDAYINGFDIVFSARYSQAGKTKRYLVEDIYKGYVDKKIMNYVVLTTSKNEALNDELVLFLIRTKPHFTIALSVVNSKSKFNLPGDGPGGSLSLEELQGIIDRHSVESSTEESP